MVAVLAAQMVLAVDMDQVPADQPAKQLWEVRRLEPVRVAPAEEAALDQHMVAVQDCLEE